MSDPHFHDDRIVEPAVVEREVVRPARTRIVTERRSGVGSGTSPVVAVLVGALVIFIIYLVFQFLL